MIVLGILKLCGLIFFGFATAVFVFLCAFRFADWVHKKLHWGPIPDFGLQTHLSWQGFLGYFFALSMLGPFGAALNIWLWVLAFGKPM